MKRWRWTLPLALGLIVTAAVGFWGYRQMEARQAMQTALNNKYQRAFYDLTTHVQGMNVLLSKTLIGQETNQDARLFMNLWQEADAAKRELSQIPVPPGTMARTMKYLTQVGDYANTLAKQSIEGNGKTDEQWRTLRRLYAQSADLNEELHSIEAGIADGTLTLNELTRNTRRGLREEGPKLANFNLSDLDKKMQQFPTLIYDGPFSDHLEKRKPLGLSEEKTGSDHARTAALEFVDRVPGKDYTANVVRSDNGNIPTYRVEVNSRPVRNNERITVAVSQQGGKVVWMLNARNIGDKKISLGEAGEKAADFLARRGFENMNATYYEVQNRMAIYNFAANTGGVIIYPDLIKVSVALDNGQVTGFDATNYWHSHRQRTLPDPKITLAQAREKLSPHLERVSAGRLALIPLSPDKEQLTYEFRGHLGNDVFLIYINSETGQEERILRVVTTNEGVLTM